MTQKILIATVALILAFFGIFYFLNNPQSTILPRETTTPGGSASDENIDLSSEPALSVFKENLAVPWGMDFLPDGSMIVTERPGGVSIIEGGGTLTAVGEIDVLATGESGLHGVAIDPDFTQNKSIFLYYTYRAAGNNTLNRVSRYKLENNRLIDEKVIVDNIPGASNHDGGRIDFGPDGFLYITTGDAQEPSRAQDTESLAGKILRVTKEGRAAPGNPFGNRVYSYGHRNPQGITWDSAGRLWATEHGRSGVLSGLDELNLIEPGDNYGWPEIQGDETRDGMKTPMVHSGGTTWAPAGAAYHNGSIFFTGLRGETLYEYLIDQDRIIEHLSGQFGRLRNVVIAPDGFLYVATSNRDGRGRPEASDDKILRINPEKISEL